jgi:8-oxo-dGTP pyrophosphatase MutT (NUDIX family)
MNKYLYSQNVDWVKEENTIEVHLADSIPSIEDCASVYAFVFKDGKFLQTELRKGERPIQRLDIPGGHVDEGETLEQAVIRETFEETGVIVKVRKFVAYKKVTLKGAKPENYRYPYPTSYMGFYICDVVEELPFEGNEETLGRVWLDPNDFATSPWCIENKILFDEILKQI